jgi:hypothetical protein
LRAFFGVANGVADRKCGAGTMMGIFTDINIAKSHDRLTHVPRGKYIDALLLAHGFKLDMI